MGKADVVPSRERSQISTRKHRIQCLLRQYWDLLAALLLVLGSFPTVWLSHRTVTLVPNLGLIDDNWHLDSPFKALQGIWIGRDVAFTHGPIFQWLSSIPARSMPLSFGGLYATWNTIPLWCAIVVRLCRDQVAASGAGAVEAIRSRPADVFLLGALAANVIAGADVRSLPARLVCGEGRQTARGICRSRRRSALRYRVPGRGRYRDLYDGGLGNLFCRVRL